MENTKLLLTALAALSCGTGALAAPGDATVAKWSGDARGAFMLMFDDGWPSLWQAAMPALEARNLPADFYIIPDKGEFKVYEKVWKEKFKNPLFRFGNHTWSHNGFDDYDGAVVEFKKCTDYLRENVPGKPGRLISYAQPGVKAGRWNINQEQEAQICRDQGLVARPPFNDHGATYHLKNKDELLSKAKKAAAEGIAEYVIFHGVEVDDPKRGYQDFWAVPVKEYIPFFDEVAAMRNRGEIWVADHISVHQYETERTTAKVKTVAAPKGGYRLVVTCDADPALYDLPLTLKVEVPPSWKAAKFRQGKDGKVGTVRVESGLALVEAVPNGVPVEIVASNDVPPAKPSASPEPSDHPTIRPSDHATMRPSDHATIRPSDHATTQPSFPHWSWCGWGGGGYFWSAAADPKDPNVFYLGGDVVGLYKSTDGGRSWRFANNGLHNYGVYSLAVAPSDSRTVYAMTEDGIARSRDAAESWEPLAQSRNSARKLSIKRGATVRGVAVDPANPLVVYAGSARGEVCKSTDSGDTWTKLDYLSALPKEAPQGPDAPSGESFLWFGVDFPQGDWNAHARLERFLGEAGVDWSRYRALTAKVFLPRNARLSASIALQSGGGWTWIESPFQNLAPGQWTDVTLDFSKVTDPASCKLVHLLIRRQQNEAFKGEVGIDAVTLLPRDPSDAPLVIGDWETKDLDGWRRSNAKDARFTGATRSSRSAAEPENGPVASVVVSPTNPRLLFVAHSTLGLFRSADGGATWTFASSLPMHASHVAGGWRTSPRLFYAACGKDGLFRSDDDGLTWTRVEGLPAGTPVREIAVDPRNPKTIHLIATSGWNGQYLVSRDGGSTWSSNRKFDRDPVGNPTLAKGGGHGDLSAATNLAMSPADPDRLVISANWNNLVSHDSGRSWQEASKGADITCFHDVRFANGSVYAVAMDEGLFRSDDNGATWTNLAPERYTPGLSGHQWRVLPQVLPGGKVRILSTVSAWRAERDYPPFVLLSEDNGATFSRSSGLPEYRSHTNCMWGEAHARAIAADPSNPDVIYLGIDGDPENGNAGEGVFKSTDGGKSFTQLAAQPGSRRMFYGLAVDPTDPKRVFWAACGETSGVYVSPDAGASWRKTSCPPEWFFNLEVTPSGTVLAGGSHLWISRDHGETWTQSTKIEGVTICGIAFDPADENRLWVGATTWGSGDSPGVGVYESTDGGRTWTNISGDIPNRKPLIVRYNPMTRELWAAGPGIFRTRR